MRDWDLELKTLEQQKQKEDSAARLALVSDEIDELQSLETEFTIAGTELDQCKQTLTEVTAKNSPEIKELTERLDDLKTAIKQIDVEMFVQNAAINNANLEALKQQNLCNSLAASKEDGQLEFARWMASQKTLIDLKQKLETEKSKLTNLNNRFYELKAIPDIANLDRKITALKAENMSAQDRIYSIERNRRAIQARISFLRSVIAKNKASVAV